MYKMYKLSIVIGTVVLLFTTNNTPDGNIQKGRKISSALVIDSFCRRCRTKLTYSLKVWG